MVGKKETSLGGFEKVLQHFVPMVLGAVSKLFLVGKPLKKRLMPFYGQETCVKQMLLEQDFVLVSRKHVTCVKHVLEQEFVLEWRAKKKPQEIPAEIIDVRLIFLDSSFW
jgi:hypothetical protein